MKIPNYTLYGDYYLSDKVFNYTNWKEACEMREEIILPNGKIVFAHTLSKEELETIPKKDCDKWYWTNTSNGCGAAWFVGHNGNFGYNDVSNYGYYGGTRLGFHKNEIKKQLLDIE